MSTNPTVAQLATAALTILPSLTDAQARNFIRTNNIRSNGKLTAMVTELATKTPDEILAAVGADENVSAEAAPKATKAKAKGEATGKKFARTGRTKRAQKVVTEGPRGFRFGPVWNASVAAGEGIALLDSNKHKLLKHAESLGITRFSMDDDSAKIAKAVAAKLS